MAGPQGIAPAVTPAVSVVIASPGATAPEIHGGAANPAHSQYTWEPDGTMWLPWEVVPGGPGLAPATADVALLGDVPASAPAGTDPNAWADPTSTMSHGAPWPHERVPNIGSVSDREAAAAQSQANMALHSTDSGDPAAFTLQPVPPVDSWLRRGYVSAGTSGLEPPSEQLLGNQMTGHRRDGGWENLNEHGMDSAHVSRYARTGGFPAPPNSTQGNQRPMRISPASARNYPVGAGSPFEGQVPGYGQDYSAGYTGLPSDYAPSPDPPTAPSVQSSQPAVPAPWGFDLYG